MSDRGCNGVICFCSAHSFRLSEYNRKLTTQGKHWECWETHILSCCQKTSVITDWTEENQEGTLHRPDKRAVCLRKQCTQEDLSTPALPFTRPQRSTVLSQLSEIWLHVQAAVPKQKICREQGRCPVCQLQRSKVFIKTNTSRLVKLQGCCLQARLAHEVCSPHGSFWRMIYSDTLSTKVRQASCWHKQLTWTLVLTLTSSLMWCSE